MPTLDLSVVIPVLNEEENIAPLCASIRTALEPLRLRYEVLFVDDGSEDGTLRVLLACRTDDPRVRIVRLRRRFGQSAALSAGFEYAEGRIVVTLDGDQQNDPADIPKLLAKLDQGYEIVNGWRKERQDRFLTRVLPSRVANWMLTKVTGSRVHDHGCTLRAYRAEVVKTLRLYGDMHRFLPVMVASTGYRIGEVETNHRPRLHGRSKYGMARIFQFLFDLVVIQMITRFGTRPLQWFGLLAVPFLLMSLLTIGLAFTEPATSALVPGPGGVEVMSISLPTVSLLFLVTAAYTIMMGLLGELVIRMQPGFVAESFRGLFRRVV